MDLKYIEIDKDKIPYEFEINLAGETYQFEIFYNTDGDFFTVDLYKDHIPILYGWKLVYNVLLFEGMEHLDIPKVNILPYDITGKSDRITFENLNSDVFLYLGEEWDD